MKTKETMKYNPFEYEIHRKEPKDLSTRVLVLVIVLSLLTIVAHIVEKI